MPTGRDLFGVPKTPFSSSTSSVSVINSTANGSTGVRVKVFTTIQQNLGSAITYVSDAVNGDRFIINTPGTYIITGMSSSGGGSDAVGISLNANPATGLNSLALANVLVYASTDVADFAFPIHWTGFLNSGDIIRSHQDGATSGGTARFVQFSISLISPA